MSAYTEETKAININNCNWFQLFEVPPVFGGGRHPAMVGIQFEQWHKASDLSPGLITRERKTYTPVNEARGDAIDLDPENPYDQPVVVYGIDPEGEPWPF